MILLGINLGGLLKNKKYNVKLLMNEMSDLKKINKFVSYKNLL